MKNILHSDKAPAAIGPYSQAAEAHGLVFVSGQLPIANGLLIVDDMTAATKACMENIKAILAEKGYTLANVLKCTIYLTDLNDFATVNEAYGAFFEGDYPARVCVEVAALPKGAKIEVDAFACC